MASCKLRNFFPVVWNLLQIYFFELRNWGSLKRVQTESSFKKGEKNLKILNAVWNLKIWITVSHRTSGDLRNVFPEVWKLAQMYHF